MRCTEDEFSKVRLTPNLTLPIISEYLQAYCRPQFSPENLEQVSLHVFVQTLSKKIEILLINWAHMIN